MHLEDIRQTSHSSVQDHRSHTQISINSSEMVEGFVNLDSSSMVEMQQSTHTSTCVQRDHIGRILGIYFKRLCNNI